MIKPAGPPKRSVSSRRWSCAGRTKRKQERGRAGRRPPPPAAGAFPAATTILTGSGGGPRRSASPGPPPAPSCWRPGLGCDAAPRGQVRNGAPSPFCPPSPGHLAHARSEVRGPGDGGAPRVSPLYGFGRGACGPPGRRASRRVCLRTLGPRRGGFRAEAHCVGGRVGEAAGLCAPPLSGDPREQ